MSAKLRIQVPKILNNNKNFLKLYRPYINKEWRGMYFQYDRMKNKCKELKEGNLKVEQVESELVLEIKSVLDFCRSLVVKMDHDLVSLKTAADQYMRETETQKVQRFNLELTIRDLYYKCNEAKRFVKLNCYVIGKIGKKIEKFNGNENYDDTFSFWKTLASYAEYEQLFKLQFKIERHIELCTDFYTQMFRATFPMLTDGELTFVKNKSDEHKSTRLFVGAKLGICLCMVVWLISDADAISNDFDFWKHPGLYVYTTIGSLIVYRFSWAVDLFFWLRYDVSYRSILNMHNLRPNILASINQTATLSLLYMINLLVFFHASVSGFVASDTPLKYLCPILLIAFTVAFEIYEYFAFQAKDHGFSRGIFNKRVFYNCLTPYYSPLNFRDVYAADVLTSFTKVTADGMYAMCWIASGAFIQFGQYDDELGAQQFGSDYLHCTGFRMVLAISILETWPLWIRFAQCLRGYKDTKLAFPHLFNALKYALSIVVVLFGLYDKQYNYAYLLVIFAATVYKWWWDVVMDWGLCDILPARGNLCPLDDARGYVFLRPQLMYPHAWAYYLCILVDLVLRFLWVVSLVPLDIGNSFIGPQLNFFLGAMEIVRRCMWGVFRMEWEHLKLVKKGTPGFLEFTRGRSVPTLALTSGDAEETLQTADIARREHSVELSCDFSASSGIFENENVVKNPIADANSDDQEP